MWQIYTIIIVINLDLGVRGIIKKTALGRGGGRGRLIYKIVNFVMISIVFKIIFYLIVLLHISSRSLFISRRELRKQFPRGSTCQSSHFIGDWRTEVGYSKIPYYIRLFESLEHLYCPDGWVGGWVGGDQKGPSIFLIFKYNNKKTVLIPNMVLKVVYGLYIRSYEHFKFQN